MLKMMIKCYDKVSIVQGDLIKCLRIMPVSARGGGGKHNFSVFTYVTELLRTKK